MPGQLFKSEYLADKRLPLRLILRDPQEEYQLHEHDFSELVVVFRGYGEHVIYGEHRTIEAGDVFLGISTSGNSKNILYAMTAAKAKGLRTIGLTGRDGGMLAKAADVAIIVPEEETYKIQELHLPVYHALCLMLEERFFRE